MRRFPSPKALLFIVAGLVIAVSLVSNERMQLPQEPAVAKEHELDDAFLQQVENATGQWVENAGTPYFGNQPIANLPQKPEIVDARRVLGSHIAADGSEKWIEVDISDQKLYAWEGNRKIYDFAISSGRPGYDTVQGEFRVWRKVENQTYRGGSKARGDYYYLPNVPNSLFFHQAYAIHGAYWHNDFGIKRRSSGCVNLLPEHAKQLYFWAGPAMAGGVTALNSTSDNPGVRVTVHE